MTIKILGHCCCGCVNKAASHQFIQAGPKDVVDGCWRRTGNELVDVYAIEECWVLLLASVMS